MSQYDAVWLSLKQTGFAEVTVSTENARTVEDGVKRVKTAENTARRYAGLIGWSKLVIKREKLSSTRMKLTFSFLYSTKL